MKTRRPESGRPEPTDKRKKSWLDFTLNEVTTSTKMPANVVAFINAWREKKDVWHSPNNDPRFGVRVKDVSLYEYRVGRPAPAKTEAAPAAEPAKEEQKK